MKQIFEYKDLIYELAFRDLKVRYRKPFLGFLWMFIIPFCTAVIYKVLFYDFFHVASGKYPFFIHLITAILPWNYFASSIQGSTRSILESKNIIKQISFPKYLLPVSTVVANLINFLPTLLVLFGFLVVFKIKIYFWILLLPIVILFQTFLIIGFSLLVAGLQVIYRDVEYIVQVLLTLLFFLTPGVYTINEFINKSSPSIVKIYLLNPLVGILNLYRIAFIGDYLKSLPKEINFLNTFVNPAVWSLAILSIGYFVFKKCERVFCDHINL